MTETDDIVARLLELADEIYDARDLVPLPADLQHQDRLAPEDGHSFHVVALLLVVVSTARSRRSAGSSSSPVNDRSGRRTACFRS